MKTCLELIKAGTAILADSSDSPKLDATVLLSKVTGCTRTKLLADPNHSVAENIAEQFFYLISERYKGTPVAYLTGEKEFFSLPFFVSPSVLVPRPETEQLVGLALAEIQHGHTLSRSRAELRPVRILDLGTGSGCIAITLAIELSKIRVKSEILAVDVSDEALIIAEKNAARLGAESVRFSKSHWFTNVSGTFDLIVSNPPYIPLNDPHTSSDTRFEPQLALYSGLNGCEAYREIFSSIRHFLTPQGLFLGEHGIFQGEMLAQMAVGAGFAKHNVQIYRDLTDRDRVISCRT